MYCNCVRLKLSEAVWIASATIGGLRKKADMAIMQSHQDRGDAKNLYVDIQGVFGELVSLILAHKNEYEEIRANCYEWKRPILGYDISFKIRDMIMRADAKCFFFIENRKRMFINTTAHKKAQNHGVNYYIPILSRIGSEYCFAGPMIDTRDVSRWPVMEFGERNSAHYIDVETLVQKYIDSEVKYFLKDINKILFNECEIIEMGKLAAKYDWVFHNIMNKAESRTDVDVIKEIAHAMKTVHSWACKSKGSCRENHERRVGAEV